VPAAAGEAERRQLTVMFCDLVGSTPLSTRFDPEDLREIVGAYHRCVTDTVGRFGGFVAKYMGDGVLIYFGYPEAHEDDAERAARAGLAVIDAVGRLATQERLKVRIGIASGLVVVGDLIEAGASQERGVVGETPNLAARLQALARPGTLVVADSTRRQLDTRSPSPMLRHDDRASCCRVRFRARFSRRADVPSTHAVTERSVRVVKRKSRSSSVSRSAAIVSSVISLRTNSRG
jgi:class 3 adenylate cyclase